MSKAGSNATLIGFFVLGASFLAAATLIFVGSMRLFSKEILSVLYFDESVNGLYVGAPIKFKGVPIGKVSDIRIRYNQPEGSAAVPVFVRIDSSRLRGELGVEMAQDPPLLFQEQIGKGLRGKLQLESFITGQLFIELDYLPEGSDEPARMLQVSPTYPEIPTTPSVMARLGTETTDLFAQLTALNYEGIGRELFRSLQLLRKRLEPIDTELLQQHLADTLAGAKALMNSGELEDTLAAVRTTMRKIGSASETAEGEIATLSQQAGNLGQQLEETVTSLNGVLQSVDSAMDPASPLRQEFRRTLAELSALARRLSELALLLERNPSSILRGRARPEATTP